MKYEQLVNGILSNIGGSANIKGLTHCATRLRFQVKNSQKVNLAELSSLEGTIDAITGNDEVQVIIGPDVPFVYKEIMALTKIDDHQEGSTNELIEKQSVGKRILGLISGTFTPLIPAIIGSGMLRALALILANFGLIEEASGTFAVLTAVGNAVFYFFPIFIGFTASQKMGANPYVGATIGATLLEPNFTALFATNADVAFFGIPMHLIDYSATIIPIFCAIGLYYFIDKGLTKAIHQNLRGIFVPALSLLIVAPLTILIFGPFGVFTGDILGNFFTWLNDTNSILLGTVFAASMIFLVLFGFFWAVFPIFLQNLTMTGYDPLLSAAAAYNFAIFGVAFGFYLKSKDKSLKNVALSATLTGLLAGLSEPALYGLVMKYTRTLPIVIVASALGGALLGALNVQSVAFAFTNVFTVGMFTPFIPYIIGIIVSFGLGAAGVFILGYEDQEKKEE